ncbi:SPRY domain-containing SOCS box protein 3-like [Apostichopus japonicus]|uniref:SPRY domain-containing SOCS box protein 3-like n=1 Tax=Stichopus japonicus TaxID=307972 RepID=UPI003AB18460
MKRKAEGSQPEEGKKHQKTKDGDRSSEPGSSGTSAELGRSREGSSNDRNEVDVPTDERPCMCRLATWPPSPETLRSPMIVSFTPAKSEATLDNNKPDSSSDFDWVWDDVSMKSNVQLSKNKTEVRFHTNYSLGTASARSNQALVEGQNYWEIKMVSPVYGTDMMIGVGTDKVDPEKYFNQFCSMLGTDVKEESCGLSYLGYFYFGGKRKQFCSRFGQGAIIGVHLDLWTGSLSFYKNGAFLGVACKGLKGREWYPMVSSTAAKSSMCLIRTASFESSLQYMCCQTLRKAVPQELDVLGVLDMPPGLKKFLKNNLYWLLGAQIDTEDTKFRSQGTQTGWKGKKTKRPSKQSMPSTSGKK